MTELDTLFGVHTHKLGDATVRVRRVLTVEQIRDVKAVVVASAVTNRRMAELAVRTPSTTAEEYETMAAQVEDIEEELRQKVLGGINMLLVDSMPELASLSLTTLTWFFNELREVTERKTEAAVKALGFPTNGA